LVKSTEEALRINRVQHFNNLLDAAVAGLFLALVTAIVLLSAREWILLLGRRKKAVLKESQAVWLPEYTATDGQSLRVVSLLALVLGLAKELSGQAQMERAQREAVLERVCNPVQPELIVKDLSPGNDLAHH